MRPDQLERLQTLQEKLVDVVLIEADPDQWEGAGKPLNAMSPNERKERYLSKKNASATFALADRAGDLIQWGIDKTINDPKEQAKRDDDLDTQIQRREREAEKLLDEAMKKAKALR